MSIEATRVIIITILKVLKAQSVSEISYFLFDHIYLPFKASGYNGTRRGDFYFIIKLIVASCVPDEKGSVSGQTLLNAGKLKS